MNKINLFLLLSLLTLTFSCGDDDESVSSNDDLLINIWNLESLDYSGTSTTTDPYGGTTSVDFEGEAKDISTTIEFLPDMTYQTMGSYTITLVSEFGGYEFEQDIVFEDFLGSGTWERDGNIVRTTPDGQTDTGELMIIELTESNLEFDFAFNDVMSMQGVTANILLDGNYTFSR